LCSDVPVLTFYCVEY